MSVGCDAGRCAPLGSWNAGRLGNELEAQSSKLKAISGMGHFVDTGSQFAIPPAAIIWAKFHHYVGSCFEF
jgi:hypothetical protein